MRKRYRQTKNRLLAIRVFSLSLVGLSAAALISQANSARDLPRCELSTLPKDFQRSLETDFSSWKFQEATNLSQPARKRWQSEKPLACPGIAVGQFESPGQTSYAVLLVPKNAPDSAYKLLVYTPNPTHPADALKTVDEWGKGGAANNFIHTVAIAKVFSQEWIKKLNSNARDGILAVDSGENEYGVDVYFWSKGQYRHEPIDY